MLIKVCSGLLEKCLDKSLTAKTQLVSLSMCFIKVSKEKAQP